QVALVEETDDLASRLHFEECREDQAEPALHLLVGMFENAFQGIAYQANGQAEGQLATLRLVDQSCGEAGTQRGQFQLGDQSLEAKDESTIGRGRIVDTILVANQARAEAAQIEELIPVGAIACQSSSVVRENDADHLLVDEGDEFLKAWPSLGGASC